MSKKRVLIVEDTPFWQRELKQRLIEVGHEVVSVVDTASAAVASARTLKPDSIIMDGGLADDSSGFEAAAAIRAFDKNVEIVMFTRLGKFEGVGFGKGEVDAVIAAIGE